MQRKVLCPKCGTTNTTGLSPWAGNCHSCKAPLPFTLPRALAYTLRSLWRPACILLMALTVLVISPRITDSRKDTLFNRLSNIFQQSHPTPLGLRSQYPDQ